MCGWKVPFASFKQKHLFHLTEITCFDSNNFKIFHSNFRIIISKLLQLQPSLKLYKSAGAAFQIEKINKIK